MSRHHTLPRLRPAAARLCSRLVLALVFTLGAAPLAWPAADLSERERGAIRAVIESQIDAFRRDDAAAAFSFAAPGIQARFGTPERFMTMVRTSYPAVYRPRTVSFEAAQVLDGRVIQPVVLVGPDGDVVIALYGMERERDGSWRIDGVRLVASAAQSV
jgi:hypothetical protein